MAKFQSTKTYGTDRGLSCCFRQWKANHSHCSTLHGYSLGFKFVFESETLDDKNWVFDFGGMKPIKTWLDYMFDHTILVAEDDPALEFFKTMASFSTDPEWNGQERGVVLPPHSQGKNSLDEPDTAFSEGRVCDLRIVPGVGCEMTAKIVYDKTVELLEMMKHGYWGRYNVNPDVRLVSVECFEHDSNSAIYYGDERKVHHIDVTDMPADEVSGYIGAIQKQIRERQKITSQTIVEAVKVDASALGNLESFSDLVDQLHHIPPVPE